MRRIFVNLGFFFAALWGLPGVVLAAPVTYSFSTGTLNSGYFCGGIAGCSLPGGPHPWYSFSSTDSVEGTFVYDAARPLTLTGGDGSSIYGGNPSSYSALTGTIAGFGFSDPRGFTQVGNETFLAFGATTKTDFLGLTADPSLSSPNPRNISGFSVDGYTLVNVRMFWIEGSTMPELVPDLFDNQNLPADLPSFHGRLALDFVPTGNTNTSFTPASIFFDGLTVTPIPEPETYAMLIAGLGLLGLAGRRRRTSLLARLR